MLGLFLFFLAGSDGTKIAPPAHMFWAWEKPEDLYSLPIDKAGIALLVQTLRLSEKGVMALKRRQKIQYPPGVYMLATTRIEVNPGTTPEQLNSLMPTVLNHLRPFLKDPRFNGIQIDFDATVSQRAFYRKLVQAVHMEMPSDLWFSVTCLASWAVSDAWLADFPVDEWVPMYFQMGLDGPTIQRHLKKDKRLRLSTHSAGLDPNEKVPLPASIDRIYWFQRPTWTEDTVQNCLKVVP
ncbi:MAG: hypothetical protein H6510_17340 [Acidobacteria bacterium]|nr:hypothetical protein [Acidobacteriota bacterium]MCB9399579.1 hypothetical protein [Acidobacteriota bacterium]